MQLLSRATVNKSLMLAFLLSRDDHGGKEVPTKSVADSSSLQYHAPPPDVQYNENWTVFGSILRGELPAKTLLENSNILTFEDISPRAPLHALVIPKRFVQSVFDLTKDDLPLLYEMKEQAETLLKREYPQSYTDSDYVLCFHVPPFNSVNHLHLHVLAPASRMRWIFRYVKYNTRTRWCTDIDSVIQRLERNEPVVPYRRPSTLASMKTR